MKRRTFFKTTALSGSVVALAGVAACTSQPKETVKPDFSEFELNEFTIDDLQQKMTSDEITSVGICQKYLDRIKMVDSLL